MSDPTREVESELNFIEEAEKIVNLGEIIINNPLPESRVSHPVIPLFNNIQVIGRENLWWLIFQRNSAIPKTQLGYIAQFLKDPRIQEDIKKAHEKIIGTTANEKHIWLTSAMLYPLVESLLTSPQDTFEEKFERWKNNWLSGVDPEKLQMALSLFFQILSALPKGDQEKFIPNAGSQLVQPNEADLLAGIFAKVTVETNDLEEIRTAGRRNRELVGRTEKGQLQFSAEDLYHTTDLSTISLIMDKGLLSPECISLTLDGFGEASFAVSFHNFQSPPQNIAELGNFLKKGQETTKVLSQKVHLAFLNPQSRVNQEFILYPPDSFWLNRADRKNTVAGRYIGGYDASSHEFPDKTIAYVLIGMPSTALSFVVLDGKLKEGYASIAKTFPFYIPAYSYEGRLLYSPEDYNSLSNN